MKLAEYHVALEATRSEADLQAEVVAYLNRALPRSVPWSAVDHAAKLSPRQGARRKASGVKRGLADFRFILPPNGRSAEIELKRPKGGWQTPEQKAWEAEALSAGGLYMVCRSLAEVKGALTGWGVRLGDDR